MKKERLTRMIVVRCSPKEYRRIKAAAENYEITVSQYMRGSAIAYAEPWAQEAVLEKFAKRAFGGVLARLRAGEGLPSNRGAA